MLVQNLFDADFDQQHDALMLNFTTLLQTAQRSPQTLQAFVDLINHYHQNKRRSFAWRTVITPYRVVVSEIMLQQTQTYRVADKFDQFVTQFPSFEALAQAPFEAVLRSWKGLGYNRRAMALQKIAQAVTNTYAGILPDQPEILETLPGIGKATARSITTFAFNKPTAFIETNIRTVYIYHFFPAAAKIADAEIEPLVTSTLDANNPREWYYALMDYGVMLKKRVGNVSRLSKHYHRQSTFQGSDRQIRGMILQALLDHHVLSHDEVVELLGKEPGRVCKIIEDLCREGLVVSNHGLLRLPQNPNGNSPKA
jgi:A/G-specific adenine glycosylase